ncbi:hypothetical protein E1B28_004786 [Marasmius oreades]|uniref:non-specific serine/threonine protein kinase n=1 Tax=Marasmius oreades TaxID=181124 RepID=A0A9P7UZF4_9AGAR|nr:uncharacterized protein E1B28_004786 [Marasmius oreades]KAG7097441.1 hypothetical protein E1B28_004786 [Marasmius oreades]
MSSLQRSNSSMTFQSSDSNTKNFIVALQNLIADKLSGNIEENDKSSSVQQLVNFINGLSGDILSKFSYTDGAEWQNMGDTVRVVELSLEVIQRVVPRARSVFFEQVGFLKALIVRLILVCNSLDLFAVEAEGDEAVIASGAIEPKLLRDKAVLTIVSVFRCLGSEIPRGLRTEDSTRKALRALLEEMIVTCEGLSQSPLLIDLPCTISLFNEPRFQKVDLNEDETRIPQNVTIANATEIPRFASLVIDIVMKTLYPPLLSDWFLSELNRRATVLLYNVFEHCITSYPPTTPVIAQALARVVSAIPPPSDLTAQGIIQTLHSLPIRLLRYRLSTGISGEWDPVDAYFEHAISQPTPTFCLPTKSEFLEVVGCLSEPMDGDSPTGEDHSYKKLAASFVNTCLSRYNTDMIVSVKEIIQGANIGKLYLEDIVKTIDRRCGDSSQADIVTIDVISTLPWRRRLITLAESIIKPDSIDWMDDDDDARFVQRVLTAIAARVRSPLGSDLTVALQKLQDISSLLPDFEGLATIPFCRDIATYVLGDDHTTVEVRKLLFKVVSSMLRRHTASDPEMDLKIIDIVLNGLKDRDRGVRLNAGIAAAAFVELFNDGPENIWPQLDLLFDNCYALAATTCPSVLETLVIAVGRMTRLSHQDILGQALCLLVTLLSHKNLAVRGNAYIQIVTAAKHHKNVSAYTLLLPHFDKLAPYLVSKICTDRTLLIEACKVLVMVPSDFIIVTLPRTLPVIFANRDTKVLDALAKEINSKSSAILMKHAHEVLAHIFLLPNAEQTDEALKFVVRTLSASTGSGSINTQSVVKSCVVPLLAEIVTKLGHENLQKAEEALVALKKVGTILGPTPNAATGPVGFLMTYILGIISTINDMLQDVQGKKSIGRKREILRSIGIIIEHIGKPVANVAPQIIATFQSMASIPELSEATLQSWHRFLVKLEVKDIGPYIGLTSAVLVTCWPNFSAPAKIIAKESLHYIIVGLGHEEELAKYIGDLVEIPDIPELRSIREQLRKLHGSPAPKDVLSRILSRSKTENHAVVVQGLRELKDFMTNTHSGVTRELSSGATFDPLIGEVLVTLLNAASREADDGNTIRLLSFECLSILGAVDMDRCEIAMKDSDPGVTSNFEDPEENETLIKHLITQVLVKAFRSTSDLKYQSHLAFSIQELLRLLGGPNSLKVIRWVKSLQKDVMETIYPLIHARYTLNQFTTPDPTYPIYPTQTTYREWIQLWTTHLISMVSGRAVPILSVFRCAVRNKDVTVAYNLLPHLILNILSSENEPNIEKIRLELRAVLEDQVNTASPSTPEKRFLCAQAIFMILDHLNKWVRRARQAASGKKDQRRNAASEQTLRISVIDSVLGSIDHDLMGQAALQCKAYARSLMNFEMHIINISTLKDDRTQVELATFYEKIHEIYAHLDEPDGMEGISTMILSPSLEHQIRQHEINGKWTSAQSCWEVRIQQEPNNVEFHMGLLRCLRNLGHYDSLRTHIRGILTKQPSWQSSLVAFQLESAWMLGDWQDVESTVKLNDTKEPSIAMARLLLALRSKDHSSIVEALSEARLVLGAPVAAAGVKGYRRAYEAALNLHLTHELEIIYRTMVDSNGKTLKPLSQLLEARLEATLPTFHTREAILGLRRTAFALFGDSTMKSLSTSEVGRSWLASAKIARKAGQWQTAYSAILQAEQNHAQFSFIESSKLTKASGEPLRALRQLEDAMKVLGILHKSPQTAKNEAISAKAHLLRARWMDESERFDVATVFKAFNTATELQLTWESGHFYVGRFQDQNWKNLPHNERLSSRGLKMNNYTIRSYIKAIRLGSKYVYQTVPRLLTLWLDLGEVENVASQEIYTKINEVVYRAIKESPMYKWFTTFPQMVSRLEHKNGKVRSILFKLIENVIKEYPKQALWLFASVLGSKNEKRRAYGKDILDKLRNNPSLSRTNVRELIQTLEKLTHEFLNLCIHPITEKTDRDGRTSSKWLSMKKVFPGLQRLGTSDLLVPLQESLTASLPPTSSAESTHQPFPSDAPTFNGFKDEIEIMSSLAKPRKLTLAGSNGQIYMFLAKPKDDLRKDARLMDLYSVINKLLKGNSDSRRRQLYIRTYGVVTLNEECGLIQWVPNTVPLRPILNRSYTAKGISFWSAELQSIFKKMGDAQTDAMAAKMFENEVLKSFPPVFHEWFIETFPEPTTWLTSRLNYGRTAAVMSMVGFIIGLGDRHCENILLDENTGDVVHVDFNCLFDHGQTLTTPERVPFRLTQNIVGGLGVMGVEGIFRTACEITLQLLRDNTDLLMSILDAFLHDPLVDFEEKRRAQKKYNNDLKKFARDALDPIEKKLKGLTSTVSKEKHAYDKEISTSNLVQMLIQEAMDNKNLSRMYVGWSPHI